ncbi:CsbD family protein [Derxia lacustris]|uniref:CsbD family protein n=1 Tax=Derxia lacustris TaxID=764842 RepID=UPI000A16DC89|nr:CsbD family protein [Derxia lacustris]
MNSDQLKGRVEEAKGKVKEGVGKAVNSDKLRAEGKIDQAAGRAQATYGDAKEKVKDVIDRS